MNKSIPHPLNVDGDFYVEDGCCTMCDIPRTIAPSLFGVEGDNLHCFVKRQPLGEAEMKNMMEAIASAEMQCIRYRGDSRYVQIQLVEMNEGEACDSLPTDLASR